MSDYDEDEEMAEESGTNIGVNKKKHLKSV
jgi:hypothetical protein